MGVGVVPAVAGWVPVRSPAVAKLAAGVLAGLEPSVEVVATGWVPGACCPGEMTVFGPAGTARPFFARHSFPSSQLMVYGE